MPRARISRAVKHLRSEIDPFRCLSKAAVELKRSLQVLHKQRWPESLFTKRSISSSFGSSCGMLISSPTTLRKRSNLWISLWITRATLRSPQGLGVGSGSASRLTSGLLLRLRLEREFTRRPVIDRHRTVLPERNQRPLAGQRLSRPQLPDHAAAMRLAVARRRTGRARSPAVISAHSSFAT